MFNFGHNIDWFPTLKFKEFVYSIDKEFAKDIKIDEVNSVGTLRIYKVAEYESNNKITLQMSFDPRFEIINFTIDMDDDDEYDAFNEFITDLRQLHSQLVISTQTLDAMKQYMSAEKRKKKEETNEDN